MVSGYLCVYAQSLPGCLLRVGWGGVTHVVPMAFQWIEEENHTKAAAEP